MKALNVFKLNIFNILCFMYKCKQYLNPPDRVFYWQNKNQVCAPEILFKNLYAKQILVSIAYRGRNLWNKMVISNKLIFSDSDSPPQYFKRELKRFLLSIELSRNTQVVTFS